MRTQQEHWEPFRGTEWGPGPTQGGTSWVRIRGGVRGLVVKKAGGSYNDNDPFADFWNAFGFDPEGGRILCRQEICCVGARLAGGRTLPGCAVSG